MNMKFVKKVCNNILRNRNRSEMSFLVVLAKNILLEIKKIEKN